MKCMNVNESGWNVWIWMKEDKVNENGWKWIKVDENIISGLYPKLKQHAPLKSMWNLALGGTRWLSFCTI